MKKNQNRFRYRDRAYKRAVDRVIHIYWNKRRLFWECIRAEVSPTILGRCAEHSQRVMSIRLIAKDLFRLQREVEKLQEELRNASGSDRAVLEEQVRKTKAERDRIRKILESAKEPPADRRPR